MIEVQKMENVLKRMFAFLKVDLSQKVCEGYTIYNIRARHFAYAHTRKQVATRVRAHVTAGILLNMYALGR